MTALQPITAQAPKSLDPSLKLKLCRSLDAFFRVTLAKKLKREDSFEALEIGQEKSSSPIQIAINDPNSSFAAEVLRAANPTTSNSEEIADLVKAALNSKPDSEIRLVLAEKISNAKELPVTTQQQNPKQYSEKERKALTKQAINNPNGELAKRLASRDDLKEFIPTQRLLNRFIDKAISSLSLYGYSELALWLISNKNLPNIVGERLVELIAALKRIATIEPTSLPIARLVRREDLKEIVGPTYLTRFINKLIQHDPNSAILEVLAERPDLKKIAGKHFANIINLAIKQVDQYLEHLKLKQPNNWHGLDYYLPHKLIQAGYMKDLEEADLKKQTNKLKRGWTNIDNEVIKDLGGWLNNLFTKYGAKDQLSTYTNYFPEHMRDKIATGMAA